MNDMDLENLIEDLHYHLGTNAFTYAQKPLYLLLKKLIEEAEFQHKNTKLGDDAWLRKRMKRLKDF